ncbi:prepilin peptidase CpaA [Rhizobium sp. SG_E_25_P2]|uniref:A24 family peptidase n=1 Tax=Rhizobium sp. SG_E_25_P2 TaxID=2879942 RepID=UPI0024769C12|nr:prepilin peptidase [Rhizobium sp. SG_E_25_P2]MDH6265332.1 prepilin peptidase CpaA [Rhizobium sp. SG_E_25_P2]
MLIAAVLVIFPLCMAMAATNDFLSMTIPNRLSVILVASFLCIAPFSGLSAIDLGWHLLTGVVVFAAGFALFALRVMGGGDAKILAASAIWYGWTDATVAYFAYVGLFGGLLAVIVLLLRANANFIILSGLPVPATMMQANKVPYGIAIGAAAFATFPQSPMFQSIVGILPS